MFRRLGLSALLVSMLAACGQGGDEGKAAGAKPAGLATPPAQVGVVKVELERVPVMAELPGAPGGRAHGPGARSRGGHLAKAAVHRKAPM